MIVKYNYMTIGGSNDFDSSDSTFPASIKNIFYERMYLRRFTHIWFRYKNMILYR